MQFLYSPDEEAVIDEAARILTATYPLDRFEFLDDGEGWARLGEAGWLTASVHGDGEGGPDPIGRPTLAGVMREAGRHLLGTEFVNNVYLLPQLFQLARSKRDRSMLLEQHMSRAGWLLIDGRAPSHIALQESTAASFCFGASDSLNAYQVVATSDAGVFVLHCWTNVSVVATSVGHLSLRARHVSIDSGEHFTVELEGDLDRLTIPTRNFHSATMVGLAEESLRRTVDYVKARVQFGGPVGRFQVIKHSLADVHVKNEIAWNSVLYASALEASEEESWAATLCAAVQANVAAHEAVKAMAQFFGGVGYTWESPVHLFLKRALEESQRYGGVDRAAFELGSHFVGEACLP